MISICTVTLNRLEDFLKIFCQSIVESTTLVNEVIIVNADLDSNDYSWTEKGIKFHVVCGKHDLFSLSSPAALCAQHAYGLHQAIELSNNDYLLISDPDIFFYTKIDDFYLSLMGENNLEFIGVSRPNATSHSITYFPSVMNLFTKKEYLPPKEFLLDCDLGLSFKGNNQPNLPGVYLYPNCPEEYKSLFPNPDGHYETGCKLLVWTNKKAYNWLSFQTPDCHIYYTKYHRTTFKKTLKLPNIKILYHASLAAGPHNQIVPFTNAWKEYKETIDLR